MSSRSAYECYVCKRNGVANVRVYLDGKTADNKTIYKNEDLTPHVHKVRQLQEQQQQHQNEEIGDFEVVSLQKRQEQERRKQQQEQWQQQQSSQKREQQQEQEQQEQSYLAKVTDESVRRGITSLKLFSDLAIQVEGIRIDCNQTRVALEDLQQKMDRLSWFLLWKDKGNGKNKRNYDKDEDEDNVKDRKRTTNPRSDYQEELGRPYDKCKDEIHKWEKVKLIVCKHWGRLLNDSN